MYNMYTLQEAFFKELKFLFLRFEDLTFYWIKFQKAVFAQDIDFYLSWFIPKILASRERVLVFLIGAWSFL